MVSYRILLVSGIEYAWMWAENTIEAAKLNRFSTEIRSHKFHSIEKQMVTLDLADFNFHMVPAFGRLAAVCECLVCLWRYMCWFT